MHLAGAIIAGGRGTRLGDPHKSLRRLPDGSCAASRLIAALGAAGCSPLLVSANQPEPWAALGLQVVADRRDGCGPLGGIEAVLQVHAPVCLLAGDMTAFTAADVRRLIGGFDGRLCVAWGPGGMQPLAAVVGSGILAEVSAALDRGEHGVYRLWERLRALPVRFDDDAVFADLDTPDDLARVH